MFNTFGIIKFLIKKFRSFFGRNDGTQKTFWNQLTFKSTYAQFFLLNHKVLDLLLTGSNIGIVKNTYVHQPYNFEGFIAKNVLDEFTSITILWKCSDIKLTILTNIAGFLSIMNWSSAQNNPNTIIISNYQYEYLYFISFSRYMVHNFFKIPFGAKGNIIQQQQQQHHRHQNRSQSLNQSQSESQSKSQNHHQNHHNCH